MKLEKTIPKDNEKENDIVFSKEEKFIHLDKLSNRPKSIDIAVIGRDTSSKVTDKALAISSERVFDKSALPITLKYYDNEHNLQEMIIGTLNKSVGQKGFEHVLKKLSNINKSIQNILKQQEDYENVLIKAEKRNSAKLNIMRNYLNISRTLFNPQDLNDKRGILPQDRGLEDQILFTEEGYKFARGFYSTNENSKNKTYMTSASPEFISRKTVDKRVNGDNIEFVSYANPDKKSNENIELFKTYKEWEKILDERKYSKDFRTQLKDSVNSASEINKNQEERETNQKTEQTKEKSNYMEKD